MASSVFSAVEQGVPRVSQPEMKEKTNSQDLPI